MKKRIISVLSFVFLISMISLISAQAPASIINVNINQGYQIFFPDYLSFEEGEPFNFHVHVSNISTGFPLLNTDVDCFLHLYDDEGNHTLESGALDKDSNLYDHEIFIAAGNFTKGTHALYVWCNDTGFGGEVRKVFEVTPTGSIIERPEANFYFIIVFAVLFLFGFFLIIGIITPFGNKKEQTKEGVAITGISMKKYVKIISLWIAYGFFLWFVTIISGIANNYILFDGIEKMMVSLSLYLNALGFGINMFMIVLLIWMTWKDIVLNKIIIKEGKALLNELS